MHFWAVIVQHGQVQDTLECLESVLTHPGVRAVVVDNASPHEDLESLRAWARGELPVAIRYPDRDIGPEAVPKPVAYDELAPSDRALEREARLWILHLAENRGYAGAINAGWRLIQARYEDEVVVVLNNDVVLAPDFWVHLEALLRSGPPRAIIGPLVLDYADASDWQRPERRPPSPWTWPLRAWAFWRRRRGKNSIWYPLFWHLPSRPAWVYMLPGSCWVFPAEVFRAIRQLDEGTFLYWEESVLAERARSLGIGMRFEPRLRIYHKWSRTARGDHWEAFVRSGAYYLRRYRGAGPREMALWRLIWGLQAAVRAIRQPKGKRWSWWRRAWLLLQEI